MTLTLALLALLGACGTSVDPAELPPIDNYQSWYSIQFVGPVPGHGDGSRTLYVNDVGRSYTHSGKYPIGSVFVKEVYDGSNALKYTAIMRKVGQDANVGAPIDGGWVFTQLEGGQETSHDLCYATCHEQAPWDHAWYDYGE